MIYLFRVNELIFIGNSSEKESLRFIPAADFHKKYENFELIKRIFTEDIIVNPEPEYSDVIQQLIDAGATTKADVAQILSLYNPEDMSAILQKLINANASTIDDVNGIVKSYPFENYSVIFDYQYKEWTKVGSGTLTSDVENAIYSFQNCGVQTTNFDSDFFLLNITLMINSPITKNPEIITFFNNANTSSTRYPLLYLGYNYTTKKFFTCKRTTNNGTIISSTETHAITFEPDTYISLQLTKYDGGATILQSGTTEICRINDTTNTRLKKIRIAANSGATVSYTNITVKNFKLKSSFTDTFSSWNP